MKSGQKSPPLSVYKQSLEKSVDIIQMFNDQMVLVILMNSRNFVNTT